MIVLILFNDDRPEPYTGMQDAPRNATKRSAMQQKTRLMLIGTGAIAHKHAEAAMKLIGLDHLELWIADPSEPARQSFAEAFPVARAEADAQILFDQPSRDGDIAIVAVPPSLHSTIVCAAFKSGRDVLCEKPLATSTAQATAMLTEARRHGRRLGCCSTRIRAHPPLRHVRDLIRTGRLGAVYHVRWFARSPRARTGIEYQPASRWFLDRSRNGGGIVHDWGPYDFSALSYLLEPVEVEVVAATYATPQAAADLPPDVVFDVEHHAIATLRYHRADGPAVTVSYDRAACTHGQAQNANDIEGDRGAASFSWLDYCDPKGSVTLRSDDHGQLTQTTHELGLNPDMTMHERPLGLFMKALTGQPSEAVMDAEAVFNYACLKAVDRAARTGEPQSVRLETFA